MWDVIRKNDDVLESVLKIWLARLDGPEKLHALHHDFWKENEGAKETMTGSSDAAHITIGLVNEKGEVFRPVQDPMASTWIYLTRGLRIGHLCDRNSMTRIMPLLPPPFIGNTSSMTWRISPLR